MIDEPFWRGRRVCVTGHTGFKGAWLSLWLQALGAEVYGISDRVPTEPSLYELGRVGDHMAAEVTADVRDRAAIADAVGGARPEVLVQVGAVHPGTKNAATMRSWDPPARSVQSVLGDGW